MNGASAGPAWQREQVIESFLGERQTLLPQLETMEELVRAILRRQGHDIRRFLDIGAGDGAMAELVLGEVPAAHAVLLDFAPTMLRRAAARLGEPGARWEPVSGDLSDPLWSVALPGGRFDLIVSSFAIHHLFAERKRELYREVFELLAPGATFLNMDVVTVRGPLAGYFDEQMEANAIAAEHARHGSRSDEQVAAEMVDDSSDDRPDSAPAQLGWLVEAGFEDVELHFKWAEGAIFAGRRPMEGSA